MRVRYLVPVAVLLVCAVALAIGGQLSGNTEGGDRGGVFISGSPEATYSRQGDLPPGPISSDDALGGGGAFLIIFVHEGEGSGTLAGVPFGNTSPASFVITAEGNFADRTSFGFGWSIDHTTASITIDGAGTVQFVTPTRTFVNNDAEAVGFSRAPSLDLFDGPTDPAFQSWEMDTSIGPITGTGFLLQWDFGDVETSGGVLLFEDGVSSATFSAEFIIFADGLESGDTSAWSQTVP